MRRIINSIQQQLQRAQSLYSQQQFRQSEQVFRAVLAQDPVSEDALAGMVMICLQSGQFTEAEQLLDQLVAAHPGQPLYWDRLAGLQEKRGRPDAAIASYRRLLAGSPDLVESRYNFAGLLKRHGFYGEALEQYQRTLKEGIGQQEQVYSNISLIHSQQNRVMDAEAALGHALSINPRYVPALYNLALLQEEQGHWQQARDTFNRVLAEQPGHCDALVRLAYNRRVDDAGEPVVEQLRQALAGERENTDPMNRENLLFALGKVHDDSRRYEQAFEFYRQGNAYSSARVGRYDPVASEQLNAKIIEAFSPQALAGCEPVSDAKLIFICGMYRSGSTLLEQMLAAHPQLNAGGEINFFNVQAPLPAALKEINPAALQTLGRGYLDHLGQHFPGSAAVINKRPDNFLYLGLIRALFPNALFIHSCRQPLDNCLSVYFQQFTAQLQYCSELLDIGHYYIQYRKLMDFWQRNCADNIVDIEYEGLVAEPRAVLEPLLNTLNLEWHEDCLKFHQLENRVSTASTWQVRQPLHQQSSGRCKNYAKPLAPLAAYLQNEL